MCLHVSMSPHPVRQVRHRVTIGGWCVTLQVLLLCSNIFTSHAPYAKKYASCVSPIINNLTTNIYA